MLDAKPKYTLIEKGMDLNLMEEREPDDDRLPYKELIGSLSFLSTVSRLDISYAVNLISRHLSTVNSKHWEAAKRIFKYIKATTNRGIMYESSGSEFKLEGYCDSDYAGDRAERKSTSGFLFKTCNIPVI